MSDRVLSRRPLTASSRDQALFIEPPELEAVLSSIKIRTNVFVSGGPGSGKTTLARHVEAGISGAVVVQAEWETTIAGLICAIAQAVSGGDWTIEDRAPGTERDVREIGDALAERSSDELAVDVVVVDGANDEHVRVLFGRYRDAFWELPLTWVVTSRTRAPEPPADAFFDQVIELAPWGQERLSQLAKLRAPEAWGEGFDEVVRTIAPSTPLSGLLALQAFLMSTDGSSLVARLRQERELVSELPERLRDLYEALHALGPVSASDEQLLKAVGVSRSRLTHGLKELEDRELVHAERDGKKVLYSALVSALTHVTTSGLIR